MTKDAATFLISIGILIEIIISVHLLSWFCR